MKQFDVAIIGSGWGGFNAALAARDSGLSACVIERAQVGGTCLNSGCIPTKALIRSAVTLSLCQKAKRFGIDVAQVSADWHSIQAYKQNIVSQLRIGMRSLLKGIEWIPGDARFISERRLAVDAEQIEARHIVISTGSRPADLPFARFDSKKILSSDDIISIDHIPQSLLIIGAGVIGCEFAALFAALGVSVTVAEKESQLLPGIDPAASRKLETVFRKKGIFVRTSCDAATLNLNDFGIVLVAVGRTPNLEGLSLDKAGVRVERGAVAVDAFCRTSQDKIWAVGDCRGGMMLAHVAAHQGRQAVRNMTSGPRAVPDNAVPACVFTHPEIAVVGMHEQQAAAKGMKIRSHTFDLLGSGMARVLDETEGFLKIVSDEGSGTVIGATIVGPSASELISLFTCAITNRLTVAQLKDTIYAHPTISESVNEALSKSP